jgi:hypothetical protein
MRLTSYACGITKLGVILVLLLQKSLLSQGPVLRHLRHPAIICHLLISVFKLLQLL